MNIIAVDDERLALHMLVSTINEVLPTATVYAFAAGNEALNFANDNIIDIAFLDIEMYDIQGVVLAKKLEKIHPRLNVIFVTGHTQYAVDAYALYASGYLLKPITSEQIAQQIAHLRYPVTELLQQKPIIQCFGGFDIFVNGAPVQFRRAKSKELLAYLVDRRGAGSTAAELASVLWEDGGYDRSRQKQLSVIRLDLIKSLQQADIEDILVRGQNILAVNPKAVICDYYSMLEGDTDAVNSFLGEYMSQYSWAEYTTALLSMRCRSGTCPAVPQIIEERENT